MEKTIEKFGIPILMAFIVIIYILNNLYLTIVYNSIIFFNFIAWIMSIIRTIKEKEKSKIVPCIIITILAIISVVFPNSNTQLFANIGMAIFMYEMIDLFKIRFSKNIINILSLIISIAIIITFLLSQLITIEKYKKSFTNISNFITSPELTYTKLSNEFESLILEYQDFNDFFNDFRNKIFITPAYHYKGMYGWAVGGFKDISLINIKNKITFIKYRQDLNEKIEFYMDVMNNDFDLNNKRIFTSLFTALLEVILVISLGILHNKRYIYN